MTEAFFIPCMASRDGLVCDQEKGHEGMHGDHRKEPVFWMDDIKYMWSDNNEKWMEVPYTQDLAPVRIKENNNNEK